MVTVPRPRRGLPIWVAVSLCLSAFCLAPVPAARAETVERAESATDAFVVIAHPSVDRQSIDLDELQSIALGRTRYWKPGEPIQLVLGPDGAPSRDLWTRGIAGMSNAQFAQFWIGATFRGRAVVTPRAVPSDSMAVRLVAALPGAIAIVPASLATDGVKVLDWGEDAKEALRGGRTR